MHYVTLLLAQGAPAQPSPLVGMMPLVLIVMIFYFLVIRPAQTKQRKLEELVKGLKSGDKVILNPGILGTITGVDEQTLQVRVDDKTRLRVLRSAVSGLQGESPELEKK
jgi:preprotein translocase subunit YajC